MVGLLALWTLQIRTKQSLSEIGQEDWSTKTTYPILIGRRSSKSDGEVGGWGRDPKKCTGRDWGMGSSTI